MLGPIFIPEDCHLCTEISKRRTIMQATVLLTPHGFLLIRWLFFQSQKTHIVEGCTALIFRGDSRTVRARGAKGSMAPPDFGISVNTILTRKAGYAHHIITCPFPQPPRIFRPSYGPGKYSH